MTTYANLVLAGPVGVGKTTVSKLLAPRLRMTALDFDDLRSKYADMPHFWLSTLNLVRCLPTLLDLAPIGFILDLGGDTVFRRDKDNGARLVDVQEFKATSVAALVVLTATRDILFERFISTKGRSAGEFDAPWCDWVGFAAACWAQCADISRDTSALDPSEVATAIELELKAGI